MRSLWRRLRALRGRAAVEPCFAAALDGQLLDCECLLLAAGAVERSLTNGNEPQANGALRRTFRQSDIRR